MSIGTRTRQNQQSNHPMQGSQTRAYSRDVGMTKLVTATCTFVNSTTKQIQSANGTFTAFALDELILVEGVNLNNGYYNVTAIDAVNHAYMVLDPSPKNEGPIIATIRSA